MSTAVESVRPMMAKAEHDLHVELPDEPLSLRADSTRLAQILHNLLHNAAKYTDPGGVIRVSAKRADEEIVFRVKDEGHGIPEDMIGTIFEMFTQVKPTGDSVTSGLGIGLSLVKTLAELHGGRVEARSDGPGQGSEFTVRIPIDALDQDEGST